MNFRDGYRVGVQELYTGGGGVIPEGGCMKWVPEKWNHREAFKW